MKELDLMAVNDLVRVYTNFVANPDSKFVQEEAEHVYNQYYPGYMMLCDEINDAVSCLFTIGHPYKDILEKIKKTTKEEAMKILKGLQKLQAELEKGAI